MPTIELDHVSKIYKPRYWKRRGMDQDLGVMDVDLTIKQGEFVFVVGDSGSGKSTLLQLIAGQTKPTRGKVYVDKKDLNWMMKMSRNRAAVMFGKIWQDPTLIRKRTVEENLTLPCELDGRKPDSEMVQDLAGLLGLRERLNHLPNELSGGQQQRVAIGRALITRPAILLADEPTGNLDTRAGNEIMELLKVSNRRYRQTVIMITHNPELAKQADRILRIEDGYVSGGRRGAEA